MDVYTELIGDNVLEDIKSKYSTKTELMHTAMDIYVNCKTGSSWEEIVRVLYLVDEAAAVEKAQIFLIPRGIAPFCCSLLKNVPSNCSTCIQVPKIKRFSGLDLSGHQTHTLTSLV